MVDNLTDNSLMCHMTQLCVSYDIYLLIHIK